MTLRLRRDGLEWRELEGEVLVLDGERQLYLALNRTGTALWLQLRDGATREELVALLGERFDVSEADAARDVDAFLHELDSKRLLERS